MFWARTDPNTRQWECTPSGVATAHPDRPDGFTGRAAVGPAMPVVEMPVCGACRAAHPFRHLFGDAPAHGAVSVRLSGSTPSARFHLVRIGHYASQKVV